MKNSTVKHFLMIMANAVTRMETAMQDFKSALWVLLGYFNENDLNTVVQNVQEVYEDTPTPYISNGFQEIVSEENNDERAKSQPLYRKEKRTDKTSSEEQT